MEQLFELAALKVSMDDSRVYDFITGVMKQVFLPEQCARVALGRIHPDKRVNAENGDFWAAIIGHPKVEGSQIAEGGTMQETNLSPSFAKNTKVLVGPCKGKTRSNALYQLLAKIEDNTYQILFTAVKEFKNQKKSKDDDKMTDENQSAPVKVTDGPENTGTEDNVHQDNGTVEDQKAINDGEEHSKAGASDQTDTSENQLALQPISEVNTHEVEKADLKRKRELDEAEGRGKVSTKVDKVGDGQGAQDTKDTDEERERKRKKIEP